MEISNGLNQAYIEARSRLKLLIDQMNETDLRKKLTPSTNSIGFLLVHIADVEKLFSKNVFKSPDISVKAKTVISKQDTGEWINLPEIRFYLEEAKNNITKAITEQGENSWNDLITTQEFGTKTKFETFGRIISHTAYHTGQIALTMKYGEIKN